MSVCKGLRREPDRCCRQPEHTVPATAIITRTSERSMLQYRHISPIIIRSHHTGKRMKPVSQGVGTTARVIFSFWLVLCVLSSSMLTTALQVKQLAGDQPGLFESLLDTDSNDHGDESPELLSGPLPLLFLACAGLFVRRHLFCGLPRWAWGRQLARAPPHSF